MKYSIHDVKYVMLSVTVPDAAIPVKIDFIQS